VDLAADFAPSAAGVPVALAAVRAVASAGASGVMPLVPVMKSSS
jgi:hypothetical protein